MRKPVLALVFLLFVVFIVKAQNPVAAFTSNTVSGCAPLGVRFQDQSTGDVKFWNWDFGNGQLSNQQNPTATFSTPGTYTVTLVVRNANGTDGITKTDYITVFPSPVAAFTADKTLGCDPSNIQFTDQSTSTSGTITSWQWDFSDGTQSTARNPSKTYTAPGFYTVSLRVTSSTGCSGINSKSRYIRVVSGVQAQFDSTMGPECKPPFTATFNNQTEGPGTLSYSWDLGNGSRPTAQNPTGTYAAAGIYTVKLTATSSLGCSNTIQKDIRFTEASTQFNAPATACINDPVSFTEQSNPTPVSSTWSFGDGEGSTQSGTVSHAYPNPGTYQVKLVNQFDHCKDSITKPITVQTLPTVNFTAGKRATCKPPFTVAFTDASPNAVAWLWDFGDGNTSTQQNPSHTYTTQGSFNVKLTITSSGGCQNSLTQTAYVRIVQPVVNITGVPAEGCVPYTFSPRANVNAIDGVASYVWDFGDGGTASGANPTHIYNNQGNYNVSLRVTTNDGCTNSITVNNAVRTGTTPTADFDISTTSSCALTDVQFTDQSTAAPVQAIDRWLWDFGDGETSDLQNPTHRYTATGSLTVALTVWNNGCSRTTTRANAIQILPPIAAFSHTTNCQNKYMVNFTNESTVDATLTPLTYTWNFGDGSPTVNTPSPSHTYSSLGSFQVTLTVSNGTCTNSITQEVLVALEQADFTVSKTPVCKDESFTLSAVNSNPQNIATYEWRIGNFAPVIRPRSFNTSISVAGTFPIQLTITDLNGCINTITKAAAITVTGPTANFNPAAAGVCKGKQVSFNDLSTTSAGATIQQWEYNFGDGVTNNFTAPPFTHTYNDTGFYNVRLRVTDSRGCSHEVTKPNVVQITAPSPGFAAAKTLFCPGGSLQFTDTSKGYGLTHHWDFGDGETDNTANPAHIYSGNDAFYTVKLVVTDQFGCQDSVTKTDYIQIIKPKPGLSAKDTVSICPPLETSFTFAGADYESFYWDFGDGDVSTLENPNHFYNSYGDYIAKLYLVGYGGCLDSAEQNIHVYNPNNSVLDYTPTSNCNNLVVTFNITPVPGTRFSFAFGDGTIDSSKSTQFQHYYAAPSTYTPVLRLRDSLDCQVNVSGRTPIRIIGAIPFFSQDKRAFCDEGTVFFTGFPIGNDPITSMVWNFGDGSPTEGNKDAVHRYTTPGTYYPSFTVNTQSGCDSTLQDTVRVYRTPTPVINGPAKACINTPVLFEGALTVPDTAITWQWNLGNGNRPNVQNPDAVTYTTTGNVTLELTAANELGCGGTVSRDITVYPPPTINMPANTETPVGINLPIPVSYTDQTLTYNWQPATYLNCTDCAVPIVTNPKFTTTYTLTVTDTNTCVNSQSITVHVICNDKNFYVPNTFSPNNDGANDVFYPRGTGIERIQSMRIFNRWGQLVFEKRNFPINQAAYGWNGTVNGNASAADTYIYIIEVVCENAQVVPIKGNVTLIR